MSTIAAWVHLIGAGKLTDCDPAAYRSLRSFNLSLLCQLLKSGDYTN